MGRSPRCLHQQPMETQNNLSVKIQIGRKDDSTLRVKS